MNVTKQVGIGLGVVGLALGAYLYDSKKESKIKEDRSVVFVSAGKEHRLDPNQITNIYPQPNGCIVRVDKDGLAGMLPTDRSYDELMKKWKGE